MQYLKIADELLTETLDSSSFEADVCGEWISFNKATVVC